MSTSAEPLTIGPFRVGADGRLSLRSPDVSPALTFRWQGRPIRAEIAGQTLHMTAHAGRIPSSASGDSERREASFVSARALPALLPDGWTMRLSSDHRLLIRTEAPLGTSIRVTELIATLTAFALNATPYLTALEESGIA